MTLSRNLMSEEPIEFNILAKLQLKPRFKSVHYFDMPRCDVDSLAES